MEKTTGDAQRERLEQQIRFIIEADRVKNIFRQTYLADGQRKENDAEHSWHLALCAVLLKEHMEEEVDLLKVMTMVLIHDLVEIDAGDTYAYDAAGARTKREREVKAADRIFGILPNFSRTKSLRRRFRSKYEITHVTVRMRIRHTITRSVVNTILHRLSIVLSV